MKQKGVIALEFLILFPVVIALVYASAVYGVVFSWQVRMQIAVDRSTAAVMHLDRSNPSASADSEEDLNVQQAAKKIANDRLKLAAQNLKFIELDEESSEFCEAESRLVTCSLTKAVDGLQIKLWGGFPPLPKELVATASVAY